MVWHLFAAAPVTARGAQGQLDMPPVGGAERDTSARRCVRPGNEARDNTARSDPAGSRLVTNEVL